VQFGGQTPLNIASELASADVKIIRDKRRRNRPCRRPRPFPQGYEKTWHPSAGIWYGKHVERSTGHSKGNWLSAYGGGLHMCWAEEG